MKRKEGYYWVKYKGDWIVAEFCYWTNPTTGKITEGDDPWDLPGNIDGFTDSDFDFISLDPIPEPNN
jgi:hypothetical protein